MASIPTIFGKNDAKITIGLRKVCTKRFRLKKTPDKLAVLYYLPIHKDEALRLGLTENSLVKAESFDSSRY